jgi:DNA-binding transcriptional MerR regulator
VTTRTYLSIGDVLSLLRQEFPDITISKIRFLESQGLVNPERSPSGYRKFYEPDVERLRWVLRQQREHFLPLKVIRDRLARSGEIPADAGADFDDVDDDASDGIDFEADVELDGEEPRTAPFLRAVEPTGPPDIEPNAANGAYERDEIEEEEWVDQPSESRAGALATTASALAARQAAVKTAQVSRRETEAKANDEAPAKAQRPQPEPAAPKPRAAREPEPAPEQAVPANVTGASLTIDELCAASGLGATEVASLEGFGLIEPLVVGGALYYDEEGLTIAKLVADFARYGIEPRHLRLFRNAVDRELGLIEQVVTPLLRQRNPEARQRALDSAAELSRLGQSLRGAILRRSLRNHLGG